MHRGSISEKEVYSAKISRKIQETKAHRCKSPKPMLSWIRISLDASGTLD